VVTDFCDADSIIMQGKLLQSQISGDILFENC